MRIFVTGATGWVGSAVVEDLLKAGHQVAGLSRSDEKATALAASGATVVRGTLDDLALLQDATAAADAVVHTAFNHDFSRFAQSAQQDRRAIEAIGDALKGSNRPLLVTSGVAMLSQGRPATESDAPSPASPRQSELAAQSLLDRGIHVAAIRLPPTVHGVGESHGFIPMLIRLARKNGVSAYVDRGNNRWSAVHRLDAARVYRLALESGVKQNIYHATAEEGVPLMDIAGIIGRKLDLPVESRPRDYFGLFANFVAMEMAASSERTSESLHWTATGPTLLADLEEPGYYTAVMPMTS